MNFGPIVHRAWRFFKHLVIYLKRVCVIGGLRPKWYAVRKKKKSYCRADEEVWLQWVLRSTLWLPILFYLILSIASNCFFKSAAYSRLPSCGSRAIVTKFKTPILLDINRNSLQGWPTDRSWKQRARFMDLEERRWHSRHAWNLWSSIQQTQKWGGCAKLWSHYLFVCARGVCKSWVCSCGLVAIVDGWRAAQRQRAPALADDDRFSYVLGVSTKYPQPWFGPGLWEAWRGMLVAEACPPRAERLLTHRLLESPPTWLLEMQEEADSWVE